ncbi:MAG: hypothetical protein RMJ31_07135 [Nitrososphaerota archaeon]|nr:hypothetical protein [Nitrososphaerales archaeon]MDW8045524.1 hypothetical protein [Nitrososphaerota archaeon]
MNELKSVWASRWIVAAILQGAIITTITLYFVIGQLGFLKPEFSRVIAGGGAGTWLTVGYITYLIVGVVAVAVTALFYYHIEVALRKPYKGIAKVFAWIQLILHNVGAAGAGLLMIIGGYLAGAAMLPKEVGGLGWSAGKVHTDIFYGIPLGYPFWISAFIIILAIGVILGGLGYIITWTRK